MPNTASPPISDHERLQTRSYDNLRNAREKAAKSDSKYDSAATRAKLQELFTEKFGRPAYEWQLDVTEALLLKVDCVLIAGTGAGKTIPFMLALLGNKKSKILIVSPLKVLQEDQVCFITCYFYSFRG
jgi:bloom syndrome protein